MIIIKKMETDDEKRGNGNQNGEIMKYREMTENDLQYVVEKNIEYYNTVEDCCWTYEKAYKRIHQVLTMEDKHKKFYSGLDFYPVNNFVMMGKFMD